MMSEKEQWYEVEMNDILLEMPNSALTFSRQIWTNSKVDPREN